MYRSRQYNYGDILYKKEFTVNNNTIGVFIKFKNERVFELVALGSDTTVRQYDDVKEYHFKHGSKAFLDGYRWFRKKTPLGYAMGLIASDKLVNVGYKKRTKTFVEVFSPFEYNLVQIAYKNAKKRKRKENGL